MRHLRGFAGSPSLRGRPNGSWVTLADPDLQAQMVSQNLGVGKDSQMFPGPVVSMGIPELLVKMQIPRPPPRPNELASLGAQESAFKPGHQVMHGRLIMFGLLQNHFHSTLPLCPHFSVIVGVGLVPPRQPALL